MYEATGNHKLKTYKRYTRNKENGIKTRHYKESSAHKRIEQMNKNETENTKTTR